MTTIAGDITSSGFVDNANGLSARFDQPANLTSDGRSLYVADVANKAIRKVSLTDYSVTTLLSSPSSTIDVFGALAATRFGMVSALYFDTQLGLIGTTESAIYRVK
ncbi:MAG: hypothetical protein EOO39_31890 [Cytophagaceae bacterium]|nr:MAG: hypothetical protein EOO39_31890 [Cytophagaceae bacterium]